MTAHSDVMRSDRLKLALFELGEGDEAFVGRLYHDFGNGKPRSFSLTPIISCIDCSGDQTASRPSARSSASRPRSPGPRIVPRVRDVALFRKAG